MLNYNNELILKEIQKEYSISKIKALSKKSWNHLYQGFFEAKKYFIKIIRINENDIVRTKKDLHFGVDLNLFLHMSNFRSVVPPIISPSGTYVNRILDYWVIVYPWVEFPKEKELSEDKFQSIDVITRSAETLAQLHTYTARYRYPNFDRELPQCFNPYQWFNNNERLWKKLGKNLKIRKSSNEVFSELKKIISFSNIFIKDYLFFFKYNDKKQIINHGDFRPGNLLQFTNECLVFDFDLSHYNYPETDIIYGALSHSGPRWFYGKRDWEKFNIFIEAYKQSSNLIKIDLNLLEASFYWVILKIISLSFKEEQVINRLVLLNDAMSNIKNIRF